MSEETATTTLTATDDTTGNDQSTAGQTTEQNQSTDTAGEKSSEEKSDTGAPQGAPEQYADFAIRDGMELDREAIDSFTPVAKELNLTQDQAQKLVDIFAGRIDAFKTAQTEALADLRKGWVEGIKTDAEIGGSAMAEKVGLAVKALDKFGSPELRKALEESGLGDHPEMVRVFYRVGKAISEDTINSGAEGTGAVNPKSHAQILYPNQEKI
jgi:hypothetical protein